MTRTSKQKPRTAKPRAKKRSAPPVQPTARESAPAYYGSSSQRADTRIRRRRQALVFLALLITALIVWLWLRTCASSKANVNNAPASSAANDAAAADKRAKDKAREDLSKAPKLDPKAKTKTVKKPVPEVEDYSLFQPDPVHTSLAIVYTTRKGDTLELVAKNVLGNSKRWSEIRDMNRLKIGPAYKLPPNRDIIVPLQ